MIILDGRPGPGIHKASNFLVRQLPLIAETYPDVRNCHPGTINVLFDKGLIVARPDHRTPPLDWGPGGVPEAFDLVEIRFEAPIGSAAVRSWLYIPHHSPHRKTPQLHEVITPSKLNLDGIKEFRVHLDREVVLLPYAMCPLLI